MQALATAFWPKRGLARLDDAAASHLAAQEAAKRAGEAAAESAIEARRLAIRSRWQARRKARDLRDTPMQTGSVRELVDDMMRDMARR